MAIYSDIIKVKIKNKHIYPDCDIAKQFCIMLRTKTLTKHHIDSIEKLGYFIKGLQYD